MPVHFAGRRCEMDAIMDIADRGMALRSSRTAPTPSRREYKGTKAGTFGDFGCFSFYVTKNVATGKGHGARQARQISVRVKILPYTG